MIANEGTRSQTTDLLYIDETAIIPKSAITAIMFTSLSKGTGAITYLTSTPKGRGELFYDSCKNDPTYNEYHVRIWDVEEAIPLVDFYKKAVGETAFIQECEAEFPDASGGPFSYKGIDLAKTRYKYEDMNPESNMIYMVGVS